MRPALPERERISMRKFYLRDKNQRDEPGPVDPLELETVEENSDCDPETILVPCPPQ
jgi:hypothetical protein